MYKSEIRSTKGDSKIVYCIEDETEAKNITNASINFIVYDKNNYEIYEDVLTRIIDLITLDENNNAVIQMYDEYFELERKDQAIFSYKSTTLGDILNNVGEEEGTPINISSNQYLSCPKVFITSNFLDYEYKDRTKFLSEIYGTFFRKLIRDKNIMFIIPIAVENIPESIDADTYDNPLFEDYNIAIDLMEEAIGIAKFHFLFGYKKVLNSTTV